MAVPAYLNLPAWSFAAISLGSTNTLAPVHHVSVPAWLSALVAISDLPATASVAFATDQPLALGTRSHHSLKFVCQSVLL